MFPPCYTPALSHCLVQRLSRDLSQSASAFDQTFAHDLSLRRLATPFAARFCSQWSSGMESKVARWRSHGARHFRLNDTQQCPFRQRGLTLSPKSSPHGLPQNRSKQAPKKHMLPWAWERIVPVKNFRVNIGEPFWLFCNTPLQSFGGTRGTPKEHKFTKRQRVAKGALFEVKSYFGITDRCVCFARNPLKMPFPWLPTV